MKKKYIIVLAILIGLIISYFYFKDEEVYTSEEYSPSGKLIGTNEYVIRDGNTIMEGKFVNYNDKGVKVAEGQFVDNEPKGICSYYYDNGKIESVYYRKNSKVNLECTFYDKKGLIHKYIMCDSVGKTTFIIKFEDKVVKMYDGYSIWPLGQYRMVNKKRVKIKTSDVLKVGDTISYNYLVANIPNTKRTFKLENSSIDNSKAKRIIKSKLPAEIIVEEVLTKKGLNRIKIIAQYTFEDRVTQVLNKEVSFDINVK